MCLPLTHEYNIKMENENRGSRTYGMNKSKVGSSNHSNTGDKRLERLDTNKDGAVSFDEMYIEMKNRRGNDFSKEKAQQQFDRMDSNKDGFLSSEELPNAPQNQKNRKRPVN